MWFGSIEDDIKAQSDSNDKLALHSITNYILESLVNTFGTKAKRYLNEPLLKKSDKKTYTEF
jgi:hypothetical protein